MNTTNKRGRAEKLETVVSQAILMFCQHGVFFRPALAAGVATIAHQNLDPERRAGGTPMVRNNVGFSTTSKESGNRVARWVLGCVGNNGMRFGGKPISDGYLAEAFWVVEHHRRQLGDLEVAQGAYKKALMQIQHLHGVPGLVNAWEDFCFAYVKHSDDLRAKRVQANYRPSKKVRNPIRTERTVAEGMRVFVV